MPSKYILRDLRKNSYYHVANWGTDSQGLFRDDQDRKVFLFYLTIYTGSQQEIKVRYPDLPSRLIGKSFGEEIRIIGYGLLPDHFHLALYQKGRNIVPDLMKRVINGYTAYYNYKYHHQGPVVQGRYKSVLIDKQEIVDLLRRYVYQHSQNNWRSDLEDFSTLTEEEASRVRPYIME